MKLLSPAPFIKFLFHVSSTLPRFTTNLNQVDFNKEKVNQLSQHTNLYLSLTFYFILFYFIRAWIFIRTFNYRYIFDNIFLIQIFCNKYIFDIQSQVILICSIISTILHIYSTDIRLIRFIANGGELTEIYRSIMIIGNTRWKLKSCPFQRLIFISSVMET